MTEPHIIGILKSICKAIADPNISARDVEILAKTALPIIGRLIHVGVYLVAASLKQSPVTIPDVQHYAAML